MPLYQMTLFSVLLLLFTIRVQADCQTYQPLVCKLDPDLTYEGSFCRSSNEVTSKTIKTGKCTDLMREDGDDCIEAWLTWECSAYCTVCDTVFKTCRSVKQNLKQKCPKATNNDCFKFGAIFDEVGDGDNCRIIEADMSNYDTSFIDSKPSEDSSSSEDQSAPPPPAPAPEPAPAPQNSSSGSSDQSSSSDDDEGNNGAHLAISYLLICVVLSAYGL